MKILGSVLGESLRSVLPIFLVMALAIAGLIHWLSQKENQWGLMEEAAAYAMTVAEFVDRDAFVALGRGELDGVERERFLAPLVQVMATKRIGRLWGCRPGDDRPLFALGSTGESPTGEGKAPSFAPGQSVVTRLRTTAGGGLFMEAFSPIVDDQGASLGAIGVAIDAGVLTAQERTDRLQGAWGVGGALAVGAVCAGVITFVLNRRLALLTAMAQMAADGRYGLEPEASFGRIQEIRSLGSTFNTVMGIIQGHLGKVQHQMLAVALTQDEDETARVFRRVTTGPNRLRHGETLLMVQGVGEHNHNLAVDLFVHQGAAYALLARVAGPSKGLAAALSASALRHLLTQTMPAQGLAAALAQARQLFPLAECLLASLAGDREELVVLRYHGGEGPGAAENLRLTTGRAQLVHMLDAEFHEQCAMLQQAFPDAAPEALLAGVLSLAADRPGGANGAVLLVMRRPFVTAGLTGNCQT